MPNGILPYHTVYGYTWQSVRERKLDANDSIEEKKKQTRINDLSLIYMNSKT